MKGTVSLVLLIFLFSYGAVAQAGKLISDCTVYFDVAIQNSKANDAALRSLSSATKVVYISGSKSRNDLITANFKQTTLTDAKSDTLVILREIGNAKYLSYLYGNKRKEQNKKYESIQFSETADRKTILGYDCKKVVAKLADGSAYSIFYTTSIIPSDKEYEYEFKDLPGLVLEYEAKSVDGKTNINYSASRLTLSPVPAVVFDLPKSGYRKL